MCPFLARARVRRFSYFASPLHPTADKSLVHCKLRVKASHLPVHPLRSKKHHSTGCNTTDCPIGEGEHSLYVHPQHAQTQALNGVGEEVKAKIENRCVHVRARRALRIAFRFFFTFTTPREKCSTFSTFSPAFPRKSPAFRRSTRRNTKNTKTANESFDTKKTIFPCPFREKAYICSKPT